jgi:hypothetical protein
VVSALQREKERGKEVVSNEAKGACEEDIPRLDRATSEGVADRETGEEGVEHESGLDVGVFGDVCEREERGENVERSVSSTVARGTTKRRTGRVDDLHLFEGKRGGGKKGKEGEENGQRYFLRVRRDVGTYVDEAESTAETSDGVGTESPAVRSDKGGGRKRTERFSQAMKEGARQGTGRTCCR